MKLPFIFTEDKHFWEVKSTLRGKIGELLNIFPEKELPLRIDVASSITGEVMYTMQATEHSWFEKYDFYFQDIFVYTASDQLVWEQRWDILKDPAYSLFYLLNCFKDTRGIVIGAHDGRYGEWVTLIKDKRHKILLVEASQEQFDSLQKGYNKNTSVTLMKKLVTTDGKTVPFFEGGNGYGNSVYRVHLENYLNGQEIRETLTDSISIVDLIENFSTELDWIHIDTEGYDAKLILALKERRDLLPRLIVFEDIHIPLEEKHELENFLVIEGYSMHSYDGNTFCIR